MHRYFHSMHSQPTEEAEEEEEAETETAREKRKTNERIKEGEFMHIMLPWCVYEAWAKDIEKNVE